MVTPIVPGVPAPNAVAFCPKRRRVVKVRGRDDGTERVDTKIRFEMSHFLRALKTRVGGASVYFDSISVADLVPSMLQPLVSSLKALESGCVDNLSLKARWVPRGDAAVVELTLVSGGSSNIQFSPESDTDEIVLGRLRADVETSATSADRFTFTATITDIRPWKPARFAQTMPIPIGALSARPYRVHEIVRGTRRGVPFVSPAETSGISARRLLCNDSRFSKHFYEFDPKSMLSTLIMTGGG